MRIDTLRQDYDAIQVAINRKAEKSDLLCIMISNHFHLN